MKKIISVLLIAAMAFSFAAFGEETASAGMANPNLYDVSAEEQSMRTGLSLKAPEEAENIRYNVIGYEAELPIAELIYTLDEKEYCLRAVPCAITSLCGEEGEEILEKSNALELLPMEEINISGLFESWQSVTGGKTAYCNALCIESEESTVVIWLDVVPGVLYNLSAEKTDPAELFAMAESVFTPVQGNS